MILVPLSRKKKSGLDLLHECKRGIGNLYCNNGPLDEAYVVYGEMENQSCDLFLAGLNGETLLSVK